MPVTGSAAGNISSAIETIIIDHVAKLGPNASLKCWLKQKGEVAIKKEIKDLRVYTDIQVQNALRLKSLKGRPDKAAKKAKSSNMQDNNNNNNYKNNTDEVMADSPDSPNLAYHGPPVESIASFSSPKAWGSVKRGRGNNGRAYATHSHDGESQYSPTPSFVSSPIPRRIVHAKRRVNGDLDTLTASMNEFSVSDHPERPADELIAEALPSKLGANVVNTITDEQKFTDRAKLAGNAKGQGIGESFKRASTEESALVDLEEEIRKEKSHRSLNMDNRNKAIQAKREQVAVAEKEFARLKVELTGLEEEKAKAVKDESEQIGKVEAFLALAKHGVATLYACAQFGCQQLDDVRSAANSLANKHIALQIAYKNGEYEELNKAKSDGVEKDFI